MQGQHYHSVLCLQEPERRFDDITKLCAMVFKVSMYRMSRGNRTSNSGIFMAGVVQWMGYNKHGIWKFVYHRTLQIVTTTVCIWCMQVPIALVSLVDQQVQWFKAVQGLTVDNTPRNTSFCAW